MGKKKKAKCECAETRGKKVRDASCCGAALSGKDALKLLKAALKNGMKIEVTATPCVAEPQGLAEEMAPIEPKGTQFVRLEDGDLMILAVSEYHLTAGDAEALSEMAGGDDERMRRLVKQAFEDGMNRLINELRGPDAPEDNEEDEP